jgi:hypothetical protein
MLVRNFVQLGAILSYVQTFTHIDICCLHPHLQLLYMCKKLIKSALLQFVKGGESLIVKIWSNWWSSHPLLPFATHTQTFHAHFHFHKDTILGPPLPNFQSKYNFKPSWSFVLAKCLKVDFSVKAAIKCASERKRERNPVFVCATTQGFAG